MPRNVLRELLTQRVKANRIQLNGEIISSFRLLQLGTNTTLMPVADVRISGDIIRDIPAAANNKELLEAQPGTPVTLTKSDSGRIEITGLSKRAFGDIYTYKLKIPRTIPLTSANPVTVPPTLISVVVSGFILRKITLGELETVSGFGITQLEGTGVFNQDGQFLFYT